MVPGDVLRSEELHLHGKIDLLEGKTKLIPVERKHGFTSYYITTH